MWIRLHRHKWSEYQQSFLNKYSGHHAKTAYRYCLDCGEGETKVIAIDCTKFKRSGVWCEHCLAQIKGFSLGLDEEAIKEHTKSMKKINKLTPKWQEEVHRNKALYEFVKAGNPFSATGEKFGISKARAKQIFDAYEKKLKKMVNV